MQSHGGEAAALQLVRHVRRDSSPFESLKVNMSSVEDERPHFVLELDIGDHRVDADIVVGTRKVNQDDLLCTLSGLKISTSSKDIDDPSGLDVCGICVSR